MRDNILKKRAERRKRVITLCTPAAALCLAIIIGPGMSWGTKEQSLPPTIQGALVNDGQIPENEMAVEGGVGEEKLVPETYSESLTENSLGETLHDVPPASTFEVTVGVTSSRPGIETAPPEEDIRQMSVAQGLVYINRIIGEATAAKRAYDKMNYYSETLSAEDAEEYYGIDMEKILSSLPFDMKYIPSEHTFIMNKDGTAADDSAHFYIDGAENGNITVSCGKALPPYDCIYMLSHEMASEIVTDNGEPVSLRMGYKGDDGESDAWDLFFADFKLHGVYYRIEGRNCSAVGHLIAAILS